LVLHEAGFPKTIKPPRAMTYKGRNKMPTVEVHCPKCGSTAIEKRKNQEHHCTKCGETFYFVTPQCGSQLDLERYEL
jgi:predicted RNA-binding Zn-ribbon protein involved in translation (DUF1610 family)